MVRTAPVIARRRLPVNLDFGFTLVRRNSNSGLQFTPARLTTTDLFHWRRVSGRKLVLERGGNSCGAATGHSPRRQPWVGVLEIGAAKRRKTIRGILSPLT